MFYDQLCTALCMRGPREPADLSTIGGRIRSYREGTGLSQGELADRVGKAQRTISTWEKNERTISLADIVLVADALRIAPSDIARETLEDREYKRGIHVPVLSWVAASNFQDVGDLATLQRKALDEIIVFDLPAGDWFALDVRGDSMDRISPEGSRIIVNAADRSLKDGRNYVFSLRGDTTFKRWRSDPDRLEPVSLNMTHDPIYPKRDRDFFCVGHVRRTYLDLP